MNKNYFLLGTQSSKMDHLISSALLKTNSNAIVEEQAMCELSDQEVTLSLMEQSSEFYSNLTKEKSYNSKVLVKAYLCKANQLMLFLNKMQQANIDEFDFFDLVNEGNELVVNNNHAQGVILNVGNQELDIEGTDYKVNLLTLVRPAHLNDKFKPLQEISNDEQLNEKVSFLINTFKDSISFEKQINYLISDDYILDLDIKRNQLRKFGIDDEYQFKLKDNSADITLFESINSFNSSIDISTKLIEKNQLDFSKADQSLNFQQNDLDF